MSPKITPISDLIPEHARNLLTIPSSTIEAGRTERYYWKDLWRYRELFYFLAWRDILVRYKQTVIGIAWALIRPLLTMVVFTVVFGKLARLPSDVGAPCFRGSFLQPLLPKQAIVL